MAAGFNPKHKLAFSWGLVVLSIIFTATLLPVTTIECSSKTKVCTVYKKQTLYNSKEELAEFSNSEIKSHAYKKFLLGKNSTSYNPVFIMNDNEEVEILLMSSYKTAKKVIDKIKNDKNYKESFWLGKYSIGKIAF